MAPGALADKGIEPFGGLSWEDTLATAVMKLRAFDTVKVLTAQNASGDAIDLLGLTHEALVPAHIFGLLQRHAMQFYAGSQQNIVREPLIITASPVVVFGLAFSLHIAYTPSLAMMQRHPEKVPQVTSGGVTYYLPFRLIHVVLSKQETSVFDQSTYEQLRFYVAHTYGAFDPRHIDDEELRASDAYGRTFFARWKTAESLRDIVPGYTGSCVMQYSNRADSDRMH